jgi:1-acyl-sn-glycerol-3-phosphate acyltransferase
MFYPIRYLIVLVVSTIYYAGKAIIAGYLRIPDTEGGVYDRCGRDWARWLLWAAGVKVNAVRFENIPPNTPVVYVSNHQSFFDMLAIMAVLPGKLRFVAKKEMQKIPLLGQAMKAANQIFIDRGNLPKALRAYEETAVAVRAGMSAVVFAEGTRSRTGELQRFKKGPFVFAIACQVPVMPMYIAATFDILPKGSIWVRPKPISVYFGEPIPVEGLTYDDRDALSKQTRTVIERLRAEAGEDR